jgi:hypothetical protein
MSRTRNKIIMSLAPAAVVAAAVATSARTPSQDLPSPDTRDAPRWPRRRSTSICAPRVGRRPSGAGA